jgi:dTDP-D-glucose 4,6-dehydratase
LKIIVTGGAGFIGSAVVRHAVHAQHDVLTVDKLTYAGRKEALAEVLTSPRHRFLRADIADKAAMAEAFTEFGPDAVLNLAAESHVDRSIDAPDAFIATNIVGTYVLLEAALRYWSTLDAARRGRFRFLQVSTDEVWRARRARGIRSRQPLCAQLTVCRLQGRRRSLRTSVASHLWSSRHRHQLLEQLRTVAARREAGADRD